MQRIIALSLLLSSVGACKQQADSGIDDAPATAIPQERLVDQAGAGNGASARGRSAVTSVDPQPAGSTSSAPGAATSGPAGSGQGTGGADGGRTLGDH